MRSLELTDGFGLDNLQVVERPKPEAGPGQVVVKIAAAALNYRDVRTIASGANLRPGDLPVTPLSDAVGIVDSVGPGVSEVQVGQRVCPMFFQDWEAGGPSKARYTSSLGVPLPGVGREYALLSARGVAPAPDFLTDLEAATLPCAALTAWRALVESVQVRPGGTVLLLGTGGVSIFALQFAVAAGLRTIITSSSDDKLARARSLGAHQTINYVTHPEWFREVKRLTDGRGVDLVVEVGGPGTIAQSLRSVRVGGDLMIVGAVSGQGAGFDVASMIPTGVNLRGVNVGSREMFENMCRLIDFKQLRPVIDRVYPWTQAREALLAMQKGEHFGKIVLDFSS